MDKNRIFSAKTIRRFALSACLLFGAGVVGLYWWLLADLPPLSTIESRMVRPTTQILDRNGRLLYEVLDPETGKQLNLSLAEVPQACIHATLATEDSRFYQHPGVDPVAVLRAVVQNYRADGTIVSGGSTLTMQLARNLFLDSEERYTQSLRRKLREAWLAWRLEQRYTKDQILALYLNQTYYGNFAFGLEAAAQIFFAKPTAQLSPGECTVLAGLVQYPTGYNPLQEPQIAKNRQLTVLRLMREAGYVTQAESDAIAAEPLRYRSRLFEIKAPHFVMYIQDLLARQLGVDRLREGGLRVTTTLDLNLQQQAERAIRHRLALLNCTLPGSCDKTTDPNRRVDNAAAIILDSQSGEILAMVGSPDYFDAAIQGNLNAALAERQPGSAIKPLTYAAALDPAWAAQAGVQPLTPATIIADLPTTFYVTDEKGGNTPYVPVNYDRAYHGPVSVRTALANSYNIPAVKTLDRIGVETLKRIATQAGITTFGGDFGLALTLGGGEVKLLELTAAFGIFENGRRLDTQAIREIRALKDEPEALRNGPWRFSQRTPAAARNAVISPQAAYLITDILSDNLARIPAFGEQSVVELPCPAAVKTGTTTDWRDNWTIGYSTARIVGVWVGNADNTPMLDVSGIDGAGPIWRDLMLAAHDEPPPPFPRPAGIEEVAICAPSGLLPTAYCTRTRLERFITGSAPTKPDNQFQPITIDLASGQPATTETPADRRGERVYWQLPPAYHDWMVSQNIALMTTTPTDGTPVRLDAGEAVATTISTAPLILSAPTSNTAYELHPGVPRPNQRIEVAGYVADGEPWRALRLVKDGEIIMQGDNVARLQGWWMLTAGQHHFWLEGKRVEEGEWIRSNDAFVVVAPFTPAVATGPG
ncbi:MAG: transglycosylase domain-containing protein [Caldilineaceae bacterium]